MCFTVKNLKNEVMSFKVSDNFVFTTSSSSLSSCTIRAVDAMVSWRDGWSSQDTLSGTSVSPKSSKEALAARLVLAGLILYVPLNEVTACLKVSYCAAEIFLLSPSASSSSENALLESMSNAALKLSGDSSRAADSTDEDLESGERDLESLDSLWFLDLLTGVLGGLMGVLACLSASLARLTRELIELCGVWRNLSRDLVLAGDPAGVTDLLLSESRSGTGKDAWTVGLMELSGTLGSSKRRWSNVHIDIKSTSVAWLMVFGMEGKRGGVLIPVRMETSGPPTGVAAGFSCPADPSTPAAGRGAGPSESSGSSNRNCELCDDSTIETSAVLSVSTTVVGPSTVTGPSPVAEPSRCRAVTCGWAVTCSRAVPCGRAVACGRAVICGRVVACDRAVARCRPVTRGRAAARCRARTCWAVRYRPRTCWALRYWNCWGRFNMNLSSRRGNHRDGGFLRGLGFRRG